MVSQKNASNQRNDVRCAVVGGKEAVLRIKRRNVPVALVDESTGGFAVRIGDADPVEVGDVLLLRTAMGAFKVRVARVTQDASPGGMAGGYEQASRILGLQRLEDLVEDVLVEARSRSTLSQSVSGILDLSTILVAGAIVILCIGGLWAATVFTGESEEESWAWNSSSTGSRVSFGNAANTSPSLPNRSNWRKHAAKTTTSPRPAERSDTVVVSRSSGSLRSQFRKQDQRVARTPAAASLLSPKTIDRLALTDKQQDAIRGILESSELFRNDSGSWVLETPDQLDGRLDSRIAEIEDAALKLLNDEQRARWSELRPSG